MPTQSENIVTRISSNVFYKEFTFDKNEFYPYDGKKELADNVLWIDNLLFVIQVKERNINEIKTEKEENKWFENTVLKTAKNQIKKSINFFQKYKEIKIKNIRNHQIDISKANLNQINKVIIYMPNSSLISESNKSMKFYESKQSGNIHIFNIEDYSWICKYLITPTELDEYLKFRERIYLRHKNIISFYPEQYILGHFLNTDDESIINERYIDTATKLEDDVDEFDVSGILNIFLEKIRIEGQKNITDYYSIIKEIAKLKRYELLEFKSRFKKTIDNINSSEFSLPYRFTIPRTGCGFVFISLPPKKLDHWKNVLINFTEIYKYKRKLNKCLSVLIYKTDEYFDMNWAFTNYDWIYNKELEEAVKQDIELYKSGKIKKIVRYKFKK
ncbi:hypothetical protein ACS5NO_09820 [Larkinella sp. GY13]|uniref:hypothetical protein n=1 Tax=Larkinella sp. GY13 TaxID=3453720 RepID=UPI003EF00127